MPNDNKLSTWLPPLTDANPMGTKFRLPQQPKKTEPTVATKLDEEWARLGRGVETLVSPTMPDIDAQLSEATGGVSPWLVDTSPLGLVSMGVAPKVLKPLTSLIKAGKGGFDLKVGALRRMEEALKRGFDSKADWSPLSHNLSAFNDDPQAARRFARLFGATSPNTSVGQNTREALALQAAMLRGQNEPFTTASVGALGVTNTPSKVPNINRAIADQPLSSSQGEPGKVEAFAGLLEGRKHSPQSPIIPLDIHALSGVGASEEDISQAIPQLRKFLTEQTGTKPRGYAPVYNAAADIYARGLNEVAPGMEPNLSFPPFWEGVRLLKGYDESPGLRQFTGGLLETPGGMMDQQKVQAARDGINPSDIASHLPNVLAKKRSQVSVPQLPPPPQLVDLIHFSRTPGLKTLDPNFMGTGFPAEQVKQGHPGTVFEYLRNTPYEREISGMPNAYKRRADISSYYDLKADPQGFVNAQGRFVSTPHGQLWEPAKPPVEAIKAAGFLGYHDGNIVGSFGPVDVQPDFSVPEIEALIRKYGGENQSYAKTPPQAGMEISDAYEAMPHTPQDPPTAEAYAALREELSQQLEDIKAAGYEIIPSMEDPYPGGSPQMRDDVKFNKRLKFFQTQDIPPDHPLAQKDPKTGMMWNDIFRAVHDALAHAGGGYSFGPVGETRAAAVHASTLSPNALPALFSETMGQNSYVNFGPHMRVANPPPQGQRPFADQKAGVLPPQIQNLIQSILREQR